MVQPGGEGMNAIGNMHEVRLPNIDIVSNIIYYILPLTVNSFLQ